MATPYPEGSPLIANTSTSRNPRRGAIEVGDGHTWDILEPSTDNYVLMLDATADLGVKWAAAGAASAIQATYILQTADENYTNAQALDALGGGMLMANNSGVVGIAEPGVQYYAPSGTIALADLAAIPTKNVLANTTGGSAAAGGVTLSALIDAALTASAQGTILYRGSSGWAALAPGTNTYVLATQGASSDPHWVAPATGGSGASTANTYIVQTTASDCANSQALASLSTGLVKVTTTTGVLSTAAGSDIPSTGLTITQWGGALGTGSIVTGTATFNLATYNRWTLTLDNTQTVTLALSGASVGQQFTIALEQDSTGSCLVTWFSGIKWAGGSAPTLTTTASKGDLFTFLCVGTGSYWGMIAGQNF